MSGNVKYLPTAELIRYGFLTVKFLPISLTVSERFVTDLIERFAVSVNQM